MIVSFIQNDLARCDHYLKVVGNRFFAYDRRDVVIDKFCRAYYDFLLKLIDDGGRRTNSFSIKKIYHLGDSHCLSYGHMDAAIKGNLYRIQPQITFGAKCFHLSDQSDNQFKSIFKTNFESLPSGSIVWISFGEIDCRFNEGLLTAAVKNRQSLSNVVAKTVSAYVKWLVLLNKDFEHILYLFNVPAPIYKRDYSSLTNALVSHCVRLFNAELGRELDRLNITLMDVYSRTISSGGFSNEKYHVDKIHLGPSILPVISQDL